MIKAIVFDFDGLIFDTETPEYKSYQEIYKEHGHELDMNIWGQWVGTDASHFNPYDYLDECVGRALDREEIRKNQKIKYKNLIVHEKIRPGVEQYLISAKKLGLKIGLASSSSREWVEKHLRELGVFDYFDCIRVRDDVKIVKPDPELYLQVLDYFNIDASDAVALEDSPNGALAAKRAGMKCVIIPNFVTKNLTFGDYELKLQSMAEMELGTLLHKLNENI